MKVANKYRMPIVPYAGGTSLEGHFLGVSASIILRRTSSLVIGVSLA